MRLVQRHGRIDRIGSPHTEVCLRCFFPDKQLDDLLGLEERLAAQARAGGRGRVGVGEVLPGSAATEITFTETRDEIEQLQPRTPRSSRPEAPARPPCPARNTGRNCAARWRTRRSPS